MAFPSCFTSGADYITLEKDILKGRVFCYPFPMEHDALFSAFHGSFAGPYLSGSLR
jgi:hypothetical protein